MTFYDYLYYFIEEKEVDIIVGDFNIDMHVANPDYTHVYVKKSFLEEYKVEIVVLNIFSDHDVVRVKILKKDIDFMIS